MCPCVSHKFDFHYLFPPIDKSALVSCNNILTLQPSTKVEIELQWLILALIMVEKCRHGGKTTDHSLPPRSEERLPPPTTTSSAKSAPIVDNINNSALANALR